MAHIAVSRLFIKALGSTQRLKGYLYQCRLHLMPAVPRQAQTVAVFISHMAIDPVACWDAELVAWLACDDLLVWLLYLPVCLLPASLHLFRYLFGRLSLDSLSIFLSGCLSTASLHICCLVNFFCLFSAPLVVQQ